LFLTWFVCSILTILGTDSLNSADVPLSNRQTSTPHSKRILHPLILQPVHLLSNGIAALITSFIPLTLMSVKLLEAFGTVLHSTLLEKIGSAWRCMPTTVWLTFLGTFTQCSLELKDKVKLSQCIFVLGGWDHGALQLIVESTLYIYAYTNTKIGHWTRSALYVAGDLNALTPGSQLV